MPAPPSPLVPPPSAGRRTRRSRSRGRTRASTTSVTELLAPARAGDAHVLVGLIAGLAKGASVIVQPGSASEEEAIVHETHLRNDGLFVLLRDELQLEHPAGAKLMHQPTPRAQTC